MTDEVNHEVEKEEREGQEGMGYQRPEVRKLGSLREITQGPDGGTIDSLFGGNGGFQTLS